MLQPPRVEVFIVEDLTIGFCGEVVFITKGIIVFSQFIVNLGFGYKSIHSRCCKKKKAILTHQKPTLLFYHIILQHHIYQMFYRSILYIKIILTTH